MHCTIFDYKNRTRILGTHVPMEEPSTASKAEAVEFHSITSSARASSDGGILRH
jgi:hypothetical protein